MKNKKQTISQGHPNRVPIHLSRAKLNRRIAYSLIYLRKCSTFKSHSGYLIVYFHHRKRNGKPIDHKVIDTYYVICFSDGL